MLRVGEDEGSLSAPFHANAAFTPSPLYFAADVVFFFPFAGGACAFSVALRARLRSRFFALDRLRVFSRAFSFGMVGLPDESVKF
jgi:hypothetical protein